MLRNVLARKIGVDTQEKYDILVLEGIPSHKEGTLPSLSRGSLSGKTDWVTLVVWTVRFLPLWF